jgi:hypothetical protein
VWAGRLKTLVVGESFRNMVRFGERVRAGRGGGALRPVQAPRQGGVVIFVASYFSSTDVSNELCAANDYDRETLVDQLIH